MDNSSPKTNQRTATDNVNQYLKNSEKKPSSNLFNLAYNDFDNNQQYQPKVFCFYIKINRKVKGLFTTVGKM